MTALTQRLADHLHTTAGIDVPADSITVTDVDVDWVPADEQNPWARQEWEITYTFPHEGTTQTRRFTADDPREHNIVRLLLLLAANGRS